MLNRVAIYSSGSNAKTTEVIKRLIEELCRNDIHVQLYEKSVEPGSCRGSMIEKFADLESLDEKPDLVISVGGDGTFLETMLKVRDLGIPVAGINTGRLGFLANISEDEIIASLEMLYKGDYEILSRSLLEITEPSDLFNDGSPVALNEITIQKSDLSMITINVHINGRYLNTYWADGLIISTATGSTAYNLSTGGPILSPEDESIIISPISPHNLTIRPIIVSGNSSLKLVVEGRSEEYLATSDFRWKKLPFREQISIVRSSMKLKTVMLNDRDFYGTLRSKLMWGADKRN